MPERGTLPPALPQTGPARLLLELAEVRPDGLRALARVPRASPFRRQAAEGARVPSLLAIEMAAQAAAAQERACEGLREPSSEGSPGLLVGLRAVVLHADEVEAEQEFHVEVRLEQDASPLRQWSFNVRAGASPVAEGSLTTYRAP